MKTTFKHITYKEFKSYLLEHGYTELKKSDKKFGSEIGRSNDTHGDPRSIRKARGGWESVSHVFGNGKDFVLVCQKCNRNYMDPWTGKTINGRPINNICKVAVWHEGNRDWVLQNNLEQLNDTVGIQ